MRIAFKLKQSALPLRSIRAIKDMNMNLSRPSSVIAAERLLCLSAAIAALFAIAAYVGLLPLDIPGGVALLSLITASFIALCAVKIGIGRNWARWAMLVFFVLGLLMLPLAGTISPHAMVSMPTPLVVYGFIQCVIQLTALVLVFVPASRIWFRPAAQVIA